MEGGQACSLIGQEILRLFLEENVTHFITGMALGAEQICAEMVLELKGTCPQLCHPL